MGIAHIFNSGKFQGFDNNGQPASNGKLYITDTNGEQVATYRDGKLSSVNTYPIILTASGKADVFLKDGVYNITLTDSKGVTIWTINNYVSGDTNLSNVSGDTILEKLKGVDGAGSGLDADKLDGLESNHFLRSDVVGETLTGTIKSTNSSNAAGDNFIVDTSNKSNTLFAFVAKRNGVNVGGVRVDGTVISKGYEVWTADNGGLGSGIDADLLRGLPADFTCSKNANGYTKLPNGLIIQWGQEHSTDINPYNVTFPITFPNAVLSGVVTIESGWSAMIAGKAYNWSKTGFTFYTKRCHDDTECCVDYFRWIAIGY